MNWNQLAEIAIAVVISFGGAGAIIAAIVKFAVDKIASALEKKYELKMSKEMERFKNALENKSYISKTRFDAEFSIYRQLSRVTAIMIKEVSQLFPTFTRDAKNDYDTYKKKYDKAVDSVVMYQDELASSASFIPSDIYLLFRKLEEKCKMQLDDFADFRLRPDAKDYVKEDREGYRESWKCTRELQKDFDVIVDKLRQYLSSLEVY